MLDHLAHLRDEVERFYRAVDDLDALVPSCPGWRVRDLVRHVGSAHRMFRRVADEAWMQRPPPLEPDDRPHAEDARVVDWARRETTKLVTALERLDPAAPRWNFTTGPQVGAFIPRRMLHETTIHRWDLQGAYGQNGHFDTEVARDGVREVLEALRLRWGPWEGPPAIVRTQIEGGPTIDLQFLPGAQPEARVVEDVAAAASDPERPPAIDAVVGADPAACYLAWWGRRPLAEIQLSGDPRLIEQVRSYVRT